mmetsp:Transcript_37895/g.89580  ORF Transcript_37895/g.89580 Transcript_37895/m.89580 type:complete len:236 (+) Transcript_37895:943-1650(+)
MVLRTIVSLTHWIMPWSSLSGMTENVRMYRFLRRASPSLASRRLMTVLKSIIRESFRRSSFGLHRNLYWFPSEPMILITTGDIREAITSILSPNALMVTDESGKGWWLGSDRPLAGNVGVSIAWMGTRTDVRGAMSHNTLQSPRIVSPLPDFLAGAFRPAGITVMLHTLDSSPTMPADPSNPRNSFAASRHSLLFGNSLYTVSRICLAGLLREVCDDLMTATIAHSASFGCFPRT